MSRRRRHLARTAIALLLALLLWTLAVMGAVQVFNRPPIRAWVAARMARRVAALLGQRVRIRDLTVSAYPPSLTLRGIALGDGDRPSVEVDVATFSLGQLRLVEREVVVKDLHVQGLHVHAVSLPEGERSERRPWVSLVVRQLEVVDASIDSLSLPGGLAIQAGNVQLRWSGSRRRPLDAVVVHVGSFRLEAVGVEPVEGSLMAWGRLAPEGWQLGRVRAAGPGWQVTASGSLSKGVLRGKGSASADLAELDRVVHIGARLEGFARASWTARVAGRDFAVDASVEAPRVAVEGFPFTNVAGEAHVTPDGIEASLAQAGFEGGVMQGSYTLGEFGPPWTHRIATTGRGVSLAGLLRRLGVPDAGLSGSCTVNADLTWQGRQIRSGSGAGVAEIQPVAGDVPVSGKVRGRLDRDGAVQLATTDALISGAPVVWEGRLTLGTWMPTWSIRGDHVHIATVERLLEGWVGAPVFPPELSGEATVDLRLRGPFSDVTLVGDVAVAPLAFGPVNTDGVEGSFRLGQGVVRIDDATVFVGPGRVGVRGAFDYGHDGALDLTFQGSGVPIVRAAAWGGIQAPLGGRAALDGRVRGTLAAPQVTAKLRLRDVSVAGVRLGDGGGDVQVADAIVSVRQLAVGPLQAAATVDIRARRARLDATLQSFALEQISPPLANLAGGALDCSLHGEFPFDAPSASLDARSQGGASGRVELRAQGLEVHLERPGVWRVAGSLTRRGREYRGPFSFAVASWHALATELTGGNEVPVEGEMEGGGEVVLAPRQEPRLTGRISRLDVEVEGERASLPTAAPFTVEGGSVSFPGLELRGPTAALFARGSRAADGTLRGNLSGEFPAALLALVWRDAQPRGRVELLGELSGTDTEPRFEGVARVVDGSLHLPGFAAPLTRINGVLELVPEAIRMDALTFAYGGGEGSCSGRVLLAPDLELDLAFRSDNIRWPVTTGLTPRLNGELRLVGPVDALNLSGSVRVERTVYRRELNLQRLVIDELLAPERAEGAAEGALALNIVASVPGTLEVDTQLARLSMAGDLRIVGSSAQPGVLGRLEVLPGGELELSGNRYEIDRATVTFSNPKRIDPFLDIVARTSVQSAEITVSVLGTLDHLTPTFTSNPPLPEMDVISLLSVGRRAGEAGQVEAGTLASSFLAEQLSGAVSRRARTLLDVDQLRVDPVVASQSENPTARVTVVKQISRDWTVTLATNLASNRQEVIKSRWRLGQGFYLEANRDTDGSYALEVKWQRRY